MVRKIARPRRMAARFYRVGIKCRKVLAIVCEEREEKMELVGRERSTPKGK